MLLSYQPIPRSIWTNDINMEFYHEARCLILFLFLISHCSYSHYDQKPVSIIDTLAMTLKFVRLQEQAEEEREDRGGERAGKRARTSLHPVPRFVSSRELEVMESSLTRWIGELTQDVEGEMLM